MTYIAIDFEFNQFFDFPYTTIKADPRCSAEIIQIGVAKLDENGDIAERKSFFVKPKIYTRMHPYIDRITRIPRAILKESPYFIEVFEEFADWLGDGKITFLIWGPDDIKELFTNILYYSMNASRVSKNYVNVQKMANVYLNNPNTAIALKTAVETLGLEKEEDRKYHDALSDALYTAEIFKHISASEGFDKERIHIQKIDIGLLKQSIMAKINEVNIKPLFEFAQTKLRRKLNEKDKEAVLSIYNAGRRGRFDIKKAKTDCPLENSEESQ